MMMPGYRPLRELLGRTVLATACALPALAAPSIHAQTSSNPPPASPRPQDLTNLPLEDLLNVEVTVAARTEQSLAETAAAVYVVTAEDIRRSGVINIPEALRMVPGLEVAQVDANKWAITARGFNSRFANKLLVLVDGRSVYTPLFAGVDWEEQDILLEDVERIEVVRGPGGALWGANAVNGVINIVTRKASETQGGLLSASGLKEDRRVGGLRYGGVLGDQTYYRVYSRYLARDEFASETGGQAADGWRSLHSGFRVDRRGEGGDSLTLQGDAFSLATGQTTSVASLTAAPFYTQTYDETSHLSGFNLRGEWKHVLSPGSSMTLQAYADHHLRRLSVVEEDRETYDIDFQHRLAIGGQQELVWGAAYRRTADSINGSFTVGFDPAQRATQLASAFIELLSHGAQDRTHLSLGTKVEHNDFTGLEVQPSLRMLWKLGEGQSLWTAVSRAVRTPTRVNDDVRLSQRVVDLGGGALGLVTVLGNRDFRSEELVAFETGYRVRPTEKLSFDAAAFYNVYHDLASSRTGAAFPNPDPPPPDFIIPVTQVNGMDARSFGLELAFNWRPSRRWSLMGGYTGFELQLHPGDPAQSTDAEGDNPRRQLNVRSYLDLPNGFALDIAAYGVSGLEHLDVPGYVRLDARLSWHRTGAFEVSVGGRNLLRSQHPEFLLSEGFETPTEVERSLYARLSWRF